MRYPKKSTPQLLFYLFIGIFEGAITFLMTLDFDEISIQPRMKLAVVSAVFNSLVSFHILYFLNDEQWSYLVKRPKSFEERAFAALINPISFFVFIAFFMITPVWMYLLVSLFV